MCPSKIPDFELDACLELAEKFIQLGNCLRVVFGNILLLCFIDEVLLICSHCTIILVFVRKRCLSYEVFSVTFFKSLF